MASPARKPRAVHDPTIYPANDHQGVSSLQRFITDALRPRIEQLLNEKGEPNFVGANQFIYYRQFDSTKRIDPDIYVLPGISPGIKIDSWKIWDRGIVPSFALEVVSQDHEKDYSDNPGIYDATGIPEVIVFDPEFTQDLRERSRFQVYRRLAKRGLVRVETTNGDRVWSRALGVWIRAVGDTLAATRLRLATGPEGAILIPTPEESELAARQMLAAEREARLAAEAELARLRAERAEPKAAPSVKKASRPKRTKK
jgi:Uma2 family endonuclease